MRRSFPALAALVFVLALQPARAQNWQQQQMMQQQRMMQQQQMQQQQLRQQQQMQQQRAQQQQQMEQMRQRQQQAMQQQQRMMQERQRAAEMQRQQAQQLRRQQETARQSRQQQEQLTRQRSAQQQQASRDLQLRQDQARMQERRRLDELQRTTRLQTGRADQPKKPQTTGLFNLMASPTKPAPATAAPVAERRAAVSMRMQGLRAAFAASAGAAAGGAKPSTPSAVAAFRKAQTDRRTPAPSISRNFNAQSFGNDPAKGLDGQFATRALDHARTISGPKAVIGKFPQYTNVGTFAGTKPFQITPEQWNAMSGPARWRENRRFLDEQIAAGSRFVLSSPARRATGYYAWELSYLRSKGYTLAPNGLEMVRK